MQPMNILLAVLSGGGTTGDEGTFWAPYYIGGGTLLFLLALLGALIAFGGGREHS